MMIDTPPLWTRSAKLAQPTSASQFVPNRFSYEAVIDWLEFSATRTRITK